MENVRLSTRICFFKLVFQRSLCKGQQGNVTGALHFTGNRALVFGTCTGLTPGANLSVLIDIPSKQVGIFIIDFYCFIGAELANLWARRKAAVVASAGTPCSRSTVIEFFSHFFYLNFSPESSILGFLI
jgi:hypothetical protein